MIYKRQITSSKSIRYLYSDFTEKHYKDLLKLAKKKYSFEFFSKSIKKYPHVLWRHDVDFSVHRALRLATIEYEMGIYSTYFLRLHSEFYNIFEKEVYDKINSIINLGHEIGLHFDYGFYSNKTKNKIYSKLKYEKQIIEKLFSIKIKSVSFHNPTLKNTIPLNDNILADMINTSSKKIKKNYFYCSDSNGYWRFTRLKDLLSLRIEPRIHVLTHPEWWQKIPMSPWTRVERSINGRANKTKKFYIKITRETGRKNIR